MKLKFIEQQYQTDAVNSIVDIFDGCQVKESLFTIDISKGIYEGLQGKGVSYELGYSNKCTIGEGEMLENVRKIQERNNIKKKKSLDGRNFTIEMETGTGKTYVYTKTILELNKKYGFTKFIVVVPSIAIKEGVHKSFKITEEHFKLKYDNVVYNYFVYDSNKLNRIQQFATSSNIEIMIINIDAFRKSFDDPTKENKANLIHRPTDKLSGNKPIDLISGTNPIVIIDEPQSVDNTQKSKEAIKSLNPLCTLRYSATHKVMYNLMYRLTPVDAYQQHLVKSIEVSSVMSDEQTAKPYVKLLGVSNDKGFRAKLEIFVRNKKDGSIEKKTVTAKVGSDLWDLSNEVDYYHSNGYVVDDMNAEKGEEDIIFTNGEYLHLGEAIGEVNDEAIKRAQIRETIDIHLSKELKYIGKGIKVLSLIFIDKVSNYRLYETNGETKGKYAKWFEEEYAQLINGKYSRLKTMYPNICFDPTRVHEGYFSKDGKGRLKDTNGETSDDDTTYSLIMQEKEKLLGFDEPVRFIFSHSALKEGWDNPNVFQVCTLIETKDTFTKRQKVGRGLRISVNQSGERVMDYKFNTLSVIANESYKEFATTLQKEFSENGYKFGVIESVSFAGLEVKDKNNVEKELTQEDSEKIFEFLKEKGYIGSNNKATEEFYSDDHNNKVEVPEEYEEFKDKIIDTVKQLSKEIEIKNKNEKVKVSRNNKVINSEIFNTMWNKIKQKTIYSVHLPLDEMKALAISYVRDMPKIESEKIRRERIKINVDEKGVTANENTIKKNSVADINEYEEIVYPDFIRRLQDSTALLRSTIIEIIAKSGRLQDFYVNPELFIKQVSVAITKAKKEKLINGIQYHKLENEFYKQEEIFDDTELYGYKDKNIVDVSDPDKNPFDHVIFDSIIERQFAAACDEDEEVKLYAKLPSTFKVDTPFGGYNPDWMVVIQREGEEHRLYFIAETKGSTDEEQLKGAEKNKIFCGRKHFEVVDTELKYEVVDALMTLKDKID